GGTGNELNLSVRIRDNIGVSDVAAIYSIGGLLSLGTWAMMTPDTITDTGNGTYNFTIVLPLYSTKPIEYWFWANDTSGNPNMSALFQLKVVDDDGSMLAIGPLPHEVTTGQELEFTVHVRDNIGVDVVSFTWWFDVAGDPEPTTRTMVARSVDLWGNGFYSTTFQVPFDIAYSYAPPLKVTFAATDWAGNNVTSVVFVLAVRDDDPPWFLEIIAPDAPTTGDPFNLTVRVWDNIALAIVRVDYWFDKGLGGSLTLSPENETTWTEAVTIPTSATVISYFFSATDTTDNWNRTARVNQLVLDNDPPVVVTDRSDDVATTGGRMTFKVIVVDNLLVDRVTVLYWLGGGEPLEEELVGSSLDRRNNGTYWVTVIIPSDLTMSLAYVIETRDGSGNVATTVERSVRIIDDDPPSFINDLSDAQAWRGEAFNFSAEVWDNVGVDAMRCEWWFGEDGHTDGPVPLNSSLAIGIPLDPVGPLRYFFTVLDAAGNHFSTGVIEREVLNAPPILAGLDVWSVLEEEHEELDLRLFIEDRDDSAWDLTLESPDPRVTLEGYILRVHHDVEILDYAISLSVTDGRETTWHDVTVHVVGVNDPPWIYEMRFNGLLVDYADLNFTFKEGGEDVLTVDAEDEEWDPMVYTWWRNDRQVASVSFRRMDQTMTPGALIVHVEHDAG
ncbi:MAG: hypothetical protein LN414_03450, partial [Candidatus Thermoplasmatota archaeon]|nr:hypothetical protein [Candidatus Thermoplasmatota archaeon]